MVRQLYRTDIEQIMFDALTKAKIDFVEQFPIRGKHGYILDFAIVDKKIDIECDGEHYHKLGNDRDRKRNWVLRKKGWKVIRFRGKEIKDNVQLCVDKINSCFVLCCDVEHCTV